MCITGRYSKRVIPACILGVIIIADTLMLPRKNNSTSCNREKLIFYIDISFNEILECWKTILHTAFTLTENKPSQAKPHYIK